MNPNPPAGNMRCAWLTVALLFPVALLNYLDRQIFSTMEKSIIAGVPGVINHEHFGDLMAVFLLVYGLFSPVGGYVADRFNRRWVIIGSLGGLVVHHMAHGARAELRSDCGGRARSWA